MRNTPIPRVLVFLLPVLMVAQFAFADTAADMKTAEKLYKGGKFAQAEQIYQNVISKADPGMPEDLDRAFKARKKLPLVSKQARSYAVLRHRGSDCFGTHFPRSGRLVA